MDTKLLSRPGYFSRHSIPTLGIAGIAVILFAVALWGPEDIRTPLYLGAAILIMLMGLRQRVATAENLKLSSHLQQQQLDFNRLLESSKVIASMLYKHRVEDIHASAVKIAHGLVQADLVALPICNGDGTFTYVESYGRRAEVLRGHTLPMNEGGLCGWVAKNHQPAVVDDLRSDPRVIQAWVDQLEVTTALVVPLMGESGIIGGISAFRRGKPYHAYDAQLLTIFANQVGVAIENARNYTALENQLEELKRAQAQLVHAERMTAIGQLISGIAHELNNPLTGILGFSEMLKDQPDLDDATRRDLGQIHQEADRVRRIIQNMQHFVHKERPSRILANVNEAVIRTIALLEYQFRGRNIALVSHLDPRLPMTTLDVQQIEQVFLNILLNAAQAMQGTRQAGEITVTTGLEHPDRIAISIRDNGPGIPPQYLSKVFEPFFTTKEVGEGTGLGLSLSYGIVKQHGGKIRVESEPGQGACFIIELPISKETGPAESSAD